MYLIGSKNIMKILIFLAICASSYASIITTAGVTVLPAPPASVQLNQLQSNTDIFAFQENSNLDLSAPLLVDVTAPGLYDSLSDIPLLPSTIAAGTRVNTYYLSADPDLNLISLDFVLFSGRSVTFSPGETVIGIQFLEPTLLLGELAVGAPGTAYPPLPVGFGLELTNLLVDPANDSFSLSADRSTVGLDLITGGGLDTGGVDQIRIITSVAPAPEPGTILLMLLGACLLMPAIRRHQQKNR
jgi:hypothetical protein